MLLILYIIYVIHDLNVHLIENHARYASLRGYDFHCVVLEADEMLQAVSPRDAHTWYKAGSSCDP